MGARKYVARACARPLYDKSMTVWFDLSRQNFAKSRLEGTITAACSCAGATPEQPQAFKERDGLR